MPQKKDDGEDRGKGQLKADGKECFRGQRQNDQGREQDTVGQIRYAVRKNGDADQGEHQQGSDHRRLESGDQSIGNKREDRQRGGDFPQ